MNLGEYLLFRVDSKGGLTFEAAATQVYVPQKVAHGTSNCKRETAWAEHAAGKALNSRCRVYEQVAVASFNRSLSRMLKQEKSVREHKVLEQLGLSPLGSPLRIDTKMPRPCSKSSCSLSFALSEA